MPAGERSGAIEMAFDDKKSNKKKPRIAFAGEEYGFGYLATNAFVDAVAKRDNRVEDGGYAGAPKTANLKEFQSRAAFRDRFEFKNDQINRQPLRTKEQALLAVKSGTADFAVVPFYSPYAGYDFETLRAISNLFTIMGVEQYEATDQMCLAVYEPQVLDLVQSSHPGSALSSLMKHRRNSWGSNESVNTRHDGRDHDNPGDTYRADLNIDQAGQMLLRDRIDMVFAGPEAARRCKQSLMVCAGRGSKFLKRFVQWNLTAKWRVLRVKRWTVIGRLIPSLIRAKAPPITFPLCPVVARTASFMRWSCRSRLR